jgi:hypothetical protein
MLDAFLTLVELSMTLPTIDETDRICRIGDPIMRNAWTSRLA